MLKELSNSAVGERAVLVDAYLDLWVAGFDIGSKNASPLPPFGAKTASGPASGSPRSGKRE